MKKTCWFFGLMVYSFFLHGQSIDAKLAKAVQQLEKDSQMRHAILGFAVADAATGKLIYERNAQVGLAPASTQKIITGAAAFELLGNNYRYKTRLAYDGKIEKGVLKGNLYIIGSGDPTLGSWRYRDTKDSIVFRDWKEAIRKKGIQRFTGGVIALGTSFSYQAIPDGWIWQDIGNYYGAGAYQLNWKENQYDIVLQSGTRIGDSVRVARAPRAFLNNHYVNELKSAGKGTGDNAYIYLPVAPHRSALLSGTIPAGEKSFSISGAMADPAYELQLDFAMSLGELAPGARVGAEGQLKSPKSVDPATLNYFHTYLSPPLDSIHYWFMRRSINLYGEALIKTIAYEKTGFGSTDTGVRLVRDFWEGKGIDRAALNIIDGSGLSPQNRVSVDALVQVLRFARTKPWSASFYESLPTYNGMKLKSGSIGGARAFAGYHTSAGGKEYIVAIIVNNYTGSSGEMVRKMYRVLDELK